MSRPLAVLCLLVATAIWGLAFVAQKTAMSSMAPLTFTAARYLLGGVCVLPLALWENRRAASRVTPAQRALLIPLVIIFFAGTWLQQAGLTTTSVTNAGFLTGLYVLFVPAILFLVFQQKPHPIIWLGVPLALAGVYFLSGGLNQLRRGDLLCIGCAICWAAHILLLGHLARATRRPIFVSATAFVGAGLLATLGAFTFETPTLTGLREGWIAIVYAGVFSTALAFSLQAIGQQFVPSTNAAIILSAESLFACLGGALLLGERLSVVGCLGALLIFCAIALVEIVPAITCRKVRAEF